jgi:hypothetical protein
LLLAEAIAQDPTSAADAAKPAMGVVVDAFNTASGALHNLQVAPAGATRRDATNDAANLAETVLSVRNLPEHRI